LVSRLSQIHPVSKLSQAIPNGALEGVRLSRLLSRVGGLEGVRLARLSREEGDSPSPSPLLDGILSIHVKTLSFTFQYSYTFSFRGRCCCCCAEEDRLGLSLVAGRAGVLFFRPPRLFEGAAGLGFGIRTKQNKFAKKPILMWYLCWFC
jgi:hypothetical protein